MPKCKVLESFTFQDKGVAIGDEIELTDEEVAELGTKVEVIPDAAV